MGHRLLPSWDASLSHLQGRLSRTFRSGEDETRQVRGKKRDHLLTWRTTMETPPHSRPVLGPLQCINNSDGSRLSSLIGVCTCGGFAGT